MTYHKRFILSLAVLFATVAIATPLAAKDLRRKTELDRYVAAPDDSYQWKVVSSTKSAGMTTVVVDMISQTWRTEEEVDRPVWQHWLTIAIPDKPKSDIAMLVVGGGGNGGDPPTGTSTIVQVISRSTETVVAELKMIPNQPLVFHKDGQRRTEDDLTGYT